MRLSVIQLSCCLISATLWMIKWCNESIKKFDHETTISLTCLHLDEICNKPKWIRVFSQLHPNPRLMYSMSAFPHIPPLLLAPTHTHLSTHPYQMGLNSYQMVPFPHSSWKHFLPKIVLSAAFGPGLLTLLWLWLSHHRWEGVPGPARAGKGGVPGRVLS